MWVLLIFIILAYLCGSLSSAIIVSRCWGLPDPRTEGSKNPGTTNVLRLAGKKAAVVVLLGDLLKGFVPVCTAKMLDIEDVSLAIIGLSAFLGHLFPIFFGFQGGKGVATAFGVFLGFDGLFGLTMLLVWLATAVVFRYSSLAAITMAVVAPIYVAIYNVQYLIIIMIFSVILLFKHRHNVMRLWQGTEGKIRFKK